MPSTQRLVFLPSIPGVHEAWQMYLWDTFVVFPLGYILWVSRKLSLESSNDHFCDVGYGWPLKSTNTKPLGIGPSTSQDSLVNLLSKISLKMAPVWFPQDPYMVHVNLSNILACVKVQFTFSAATSSECCSLAWLQIFQLSHWSTEWFPH